MQLPLTFLFLLVGCIIHASIAFQIGNPLSFETRQGFSKSSSHRRSIVRRVVVSVNNPRSTSMLSVLFAELKDKESATTSSSTDTDKEEEEKQEVDIETPPMLSAEDKKGGFSLPQVDSASALLLSYLLFVVLDTIFHFTPQDTSYAAALTNFVRGLTGGGGGGGGGE